MKTKVGIVGQGFVGSAIREGLKDFHTLSTFDLDRSKCTEKSIGTLIKKSRIIFVCLPTPMKKDGSCDIRIVERCISDINDYCMKRNTVRTVVVKSTVPPGTTKSLNSKCSNLDIIFSPEFLTESNSFNDFKNQNRIILGGSTRGTTNVKMMFRKAFPEIPILKTDSDTAEMVKYFTNCYLATKVIFANQMHEICSKMGINYDRVVKCSVHDPRIGNTHLKVPGPDGDFGFGGHCFPKDLQAVIAFAENKNVDADFLISAWNKNNKIRKNKDWESMVGRAVSED